MKIKRFLSLSISILVFFFSVSCSTDTLYKVKDWVTSDTAQSIVVGTAVSIGIGAIVQELMSLASKNWGDNPKTASKDEYVKYSQNYETRTIINFKKGYVRVETTKDDNPKGNLKKAVVNTLLTPKDPSKVDLFSDKEIEIGNGEPFLYRLVNDNKNKPIKTKPKANAYASFLIKNSLKSKTIDVKGDKKKAIYVSFKMVKNHAKTNAGKYKTQVIRQGKRFKITHQFIYAIMRTESHFNPFAVSHVPAYGLMQVVPTSAGRDAWQFLKKEKGEPTKEYLFDADNNIEMGTSYLHILYYRYLKKVKNPTSRLYLAIASYNTGTGNAMKVFDKNYRKSFGVVNKLDPETIYRRLKNELPYEETQKYVVKVRKAMKRYENLDLI